MLCICFVVLIIFNIDLKQEKIETIFTAHIEGNNFSPFLSIHIDPNCFYPFQDGIIFGNNVPFLQYLTKTSKEYTMIEYLVYLDNEKYMILLKLKIIYLLLEIEIF